MKMANMTCVRCKARITGRVFGEFTIEPNGDLTFDEAKGEGPTCEPCCDVAKPVCARCSDSHRMTLDDREVPCTACPTPCEKCRANGVGAYCAATPCPCACHTSKTAQLQVQPSPTPWSVGLGYEQLDPGVYITDAKGLVIYADSESVSTGENLSEANARLIVKSVNACADKLRFFNPRTLSAMTLGDTMKPGGTLPLGGAPVEEKPRAKVEKWFCPKCGKTSAEKELKGETDWVDCYCPVCSTHRTALVAVLADGRKVPYAELK